MRLLRCFPIWHWGFLSSSFVSPRLPPPPKPPLQSRSLFQVLLNNKHSWCVCVCLRRHDTVPCPAGSLCSLTFFSTLRLWHGRGTGADESLRGDRDEQSVCACVQPVKSWIYYKLSNVTASPAPPQTRRPLWLAACPVHTQPVQSWIQGEKRRRRTGDCSETCVLRSQRMKIQPLQRPVSTQVNHLSKVKACFMDTHSQKRQNILLLTAVSALTGLWLLQPCSSRNWSVCGWGAIIFFSDNENPIRSDDVT